MSGLFWELANPASSLFEAIERLSCLVSEWASAQQVTFVIGQR